MNRSAEPGAPDGHAVLGSKTTSSWAHPSDAHLLTATNLAAAKYGKLEDPAQDSDDGNGPVTRELTRQGMGGRHGVNSAAAAPASSKRRRNAAKTNAPPAPSKGADPEDDYFPAKPTGRGAAAKREEDPVMEHASRHQAAEQRRRNRIKEKLDKLKTRVPHVDPRTNTASFLEAVLRYIDVLQARVHELEAATSAPRSSSSVLPQPALSSPTQSEDQGWEEEDRHRPTRPNGRGSADTGAAAPAGNMSESAYLLHQPAHHSSCILPSSTNLLSSPNISMLGNSSTQPLLLQSQSMQLQQLQQQQLQQLLLQHRLGEFQREQMEQQAAVAMLGLHKSNQLAAADALEQAAAGGHFSNIWPSGVNVSGSVFIMPADLNLQGYGPGPGINKGQKMLGNFNTLEALEMLANQASSASCGGYMDGTQLAGRRVACMPGSEEDAALRKRSRK